MRFSVTTKAMPRGDFLKNQADFKMMRECLTLGQTDVARFLGVDRTTVKRWENGCFFRDGKVAVPGVSATSFTAVSLCMCFTAGLFPKKSPALNPA